MILHLLVGNVARSLLWRTSVGYVVEIDRRGQWSSGSTLACGARGLGIVLRCGKKYMFSRKSQRYAALGTGCTLTAVPMLTQPSTLRGTVNKYQHYG